MKKFLSVLRKILAVIGWFIVIILAVVFLWTGGVRTAADDVLEQINQWNLEQVYQESALASEMSYQDFSKNMWVWSEMSIVDAKLKWWNGRWFENNEKYIYGTFIFKNGQEETLTFWFQKVDWEYMLLGITWWAPESADDF